MRGNVLAQAVGAGTVADLDLSHEFVSRLTDRALRAWFVGRFRVVVGGAGVAAAAVPARPAKVGSPLNRIPRLARDGLLGCLCALVRDGARTVAELEGAGFPVDLLRYFGGPGAGGLDEWLGGIAARLARGEPAARVVKSLQFRPVPAVAGFRVISDCGADAVQHMRLQWERHGRFVGEGDGSCADLLESVARFAIGEGVGVEVVSDRLPDGLAEGVEFRAQAPAPGQWARDAGVGGSCGGRLVRLAPWFVTVGEATSDLVPADDLAAAEDARSALLFQGGDVIVYQDGVRRQRVALVGEAEVARNHALGLSAEQAVEALRVEFGVDRVVVLPAASFHIDQEVSVRSVAGGAPVAFVPDVLGGAGVVIRACLERLKGEAGAAAALESLARARGRDVLDRVWAVVGPYRQLDGHWPLALAERLSAGPGDNPVAHFQRFLGALDEWTAAVVSPEELADPYARAFLRSLKRRSKDRASVRAALAGLGLRVVGVPAMPDDGRGVNPLNMVHGPGFVLMPTVGGVLGALDVVAAGVVREAVGAGVRVVSIPSGESQCRDGGVRCSVSCAG